MNEEENLMKATISSLNKINDNLYTINYQNDYYLEEIINKEIQTLDGIKKFSSEKFGVDLNFEEVYVKNNDSCSSFNVYNKKKQNLFGRNFDYPYVSPTVVIWTQPKNGYKSISFANGQYIGIFEGQEIVKERALFSVYDIIDGINEKGLAMSILRIKGNATHQNDPTKKNVLSSIMMKGALDYCKNVGEAVEYFKKYNLHDIGEGATLHYMFTDAEGDSVIIEYYDNKMILIKPYEIEKTKYLYATNFYLFKPIGPGNENGADRYAILKNKLNDDTIMELDEAMNLLNEVHKTSTIWSNVYNINELTVITALRQNYNILYEFKIEKPNKCTILSSDNK
jgi:choloylglycine hydrolase